MADSKHTQKILLIGNSAGMSLCLVSSAWCDVHAMSRHWQASCQSCMELVNAEGGSRKLRGHSEAAGTLTYSLSRTT